MTRPSPIIVGSVALSILVLGLEIYGIQRSRRRTHPAVVDEPVVASPPAPTSPAHPVAVTETRGPAPSAPPPPMPGGDSLPAEPDRATATPVAAPGRPLFVAPAPEAVLRDADEQAFEAMKLPDATRSAIRTLNQEHAARVQSLRNETTDATAPQRTRRAALEELLGAEAAQRFSAAEQAATKRLHNRYRWQSLHGVPPGGDSPQPTRH